MSPSICDGTGLRGEQRTGRRFHDQLCEAVNPCYPELRVSEHIDHSGIGAVVASKQVADRLRTRGLALDYDEFYLAVEKVPYLFAGGVIVLFEAETSTNISLYRAASKLSRLEYDRIFYLGEESDR